MRVAARQTDRAVMTGRQRLSNSADTIVRNLCLGRSARALALGHPRSTGFHPGPRPGLQTHGTCSAVTAMRLCWRTGHRTTRSTRCTGIDATDPRDGRMGSAAASTPTSFFLPLVLKDLQPGGQLDGAAAGGSGPVGHGRRGGPALRNNGAVQMPRRDRHASPSPTITSHTTIRKAIMASVIWTQRPKFPSVASTRSPHG